MYHANHCIASACGCYQATTHTNYVRCKYSGYKTQAKIENIYTQSEIFLNKFSKHEHQIDTLQTAYTKLLEETAVNNENVENKIDNYLKSVKEMFQKINEKMVTEEYIARKLNEETTTIEKCIIDNLNTTKAETTIINNIMKTIK